MRVFANREESLSGLLELLNTEDLAGNGYISCQKMLDVIIQLIDLLTRTRLLAEVAGVWNYIFQMFPD